MRYAGFWIRVAAAIVDSAILGAANLGITLLILGDFYIEYFRSIAAGHPMLIPESFTFLWALANLLTVVVSWLYCAGFESSRHQGTPGKILLRIKVVDQRNQRISFLRATGRCYAKCLSSLICMIGWLMVAFTERRQGLHDIIAGTFVVPDRPGPPGA